MKKALCLLLAVLLVFPTGALAAELEDEWLTAPDETAEVSVAQEPEAVPAAVETPAASEGVEAPPAAGEEAAPMEGAEDAAEPAEWMKPEEEPEQPEPSEAAEESNADGELSDDEVMVQMKIPASGKLIINPYGFPVTMADGTTSNDQIVGSTQYLVSKSSSPIVVGVQLDGHHSDSEARFVNTEPNPEGKELFLYAEFQPVDGEDEEPEWIGSYTGAPCQVLINSAGDNVAVFPSGSETPGRVAFRIFGAVSNGPEVGWSAKDTLSITVSYKFTPQDETEKTEEPVEDNAEEDRDAAEVEDTEEPEEAGDEEKPAEEEKPEETEQAEEPDETGEPETPAEAEEPATPERQEPEQTFEPEEEERPAYVPVEPTEHEEDERPVREPVRSEEYLEIELVTPEPAPAVEEPEKSLQPEEPEQLPNVQQEPEENKEIWLTPSDMAEEPAEPVVPDIPSVPNVPDAPVESEPDRDSGWLTSISEPEPESLRPEPSEPAPESAGETLEPRQMPEEASQPEESGGDEWLTLF